MLKKLCMTRFKSFESAEILFEPFTLLIGRNGTGKSNIQDALRFLNGIARGYNLAETFDQKVTRAGVTEWSGIRGGVSKITFLPTAKLLPTFVLEAEVEIEIPNGLYNDSAIYKIEVNPRFGAPPIIVYESLYVGTDKVFETRSTDNPSIISVEFPTGGAFRRGHVEQVIATQPILTQAIEIASFAGRTDHNATQAKSRIMSVVAIFEAMRFLDVSPDAMRQPSTPGQTTLSDRGDNLSSVLQSLCTNQDRKETLVAWLRELTPMDIVDFAFPLDTRGQVLVTLIEKDGQEIPAYSASDGTLRFLAMIATLLHVETQGLYFFEELDNGLHPARLYLLIQFIEQIAAQGKTQIVATTHSSQALRFLRQDRLKRVVEIYRLENSPTAYIRRLADIPEAERLMQQTDLDLGTLHESGWFEDAVDFLHESLHNI